MDGDVARPVLGVNDEDARRADRDMVDVGSLASRPPNVVQHVEAEGAKSVELGTDGLLAGMTAAPHLRVALGPVSPFVEQLRLCPKVLRLAAASL